MTKRFSLLAACIFFLLPIRLLADQGMWLPNLVGNRIDDMRAKGFRLTAEDVYSINQASMKDGIVKFGSGCTGELISAEGLLLTNHHCGYGQIQQHSTVEHDYLTNGFWAMNRSEELPNPGLEVTFLVRMEDVTKEVLKGVKTKMTEAQRAEKIKQNIKQVKEKAVKGTHYTAAVEPFYYGNQYYLFVNEVFRDVRLVAAPPSSIGKFGGDTDNWMWPRHTGDFSMFRIYADADNNPADYSPDNVPYRPKKFFKISTKGVGEGDYTMVYGFPGSTQQFITSDAVDYVLNHSNPAKIHLRTIRLEIINRAQESDPAIRIAYAAKHARIGNSWKKWQGESLGLRRLGTIDKKLATEAGFRQWAANKPVYRDVLDDLHNEYAALEEYAIARDYYNEAFKGIELMNFAENIARIPQDATGLTEKLLNDYSDYYPEVDRMVARQLLGEYLQNVPDRFIPSYLTQKVTEFGSVEKYVDHIFDNSAVTDGARMATIYTTRSSIEDFLESGDPAMELMWAVKGIYDKEIAPPYRDITGRINSLYRTYVHGINERAASEGGANDIFPDANLTLRFAYGHVEGYKPSDAVLHKPVSTIEGIMEKDNPEVYDYNIPQRLRDIYAAKDYGRWAVDGTVPVCFIATNHTTGGNSGSPVLNGNGELIGVNFDRTWLSTMSDIEFDPAMCRNISLDIRYVLFVVDKIGGAGYLMDEMVLN